MIEKATAIQTAEDKPMTFIPYGGADEIKLSVAIIQNIVATPTKSGKTCSKRDAMRFMMMCQARRLNPFEGDAFLVGYDGKNGPEFSLITAHQAFLKRAEIHPEFDGMKSGVIILIGEESTADMEGDFHLPNQKVVGGWATVYFKNRTHPITRRIRMERFNKGFAQWQTDPAGMIVKCAEADALRSSFPTMLGGLYMQDEATIDVRSTKVSATTESHRLIEVITDNQLSQASVGQEQSEAPPEAEEADAGLAPARQPRLGPSPKEDGSPQVDLMEAVTGAGYSFSHLQKWGTESGNIPDADSLTGFRDIKADVATRLLRAKAGLLKGLEMAKGVAK